MTAAVLDTSAVIEFFRGRPGTAAAIAGLSRIVLPVAVVAELLAGRVGLRRRLEGERQVRELLRSPRVEIAGATEGTAERWAVIWDGLRRAGRPVPINDIWIAASAMEHGLVVVTTDRHFLDIPQILVTLLGDEA